MTATSIAMPMTTSLIVHICKVCVTTELQIYINKFMLG